jgi:hypothetical protein
LQHETAPALAGLTARFDHAADVTLDELRAELIYPLDEQADHYFRGHGDAGHRRLSRGVGAGR